MYGGQVPVNPCLVLLDTNICYPGQTLTGRVACNFSSEEKVTAIRVRFRGRAKVQWSQGRSHYNGNETFYEMESDLLTGETTFPPGNYSYRFTFNVPNNAPPTIIESCGNIKHSVEATIDRPWAIDYKSKLELHVHSLIDLNRVENLENPLEVVGRKTPFSLFGDTGFISVTVRVPIRGYVPNQMVSFKAKVGNTSKINVQQVQFKFVQGFTFHADSRTRTVKKVIGQDFAIVDSVVEPEREKSWDLELRVPPDVFIENLFYCRIIKSFFELRGRIILPIPHRDFKVVIPLTLGSVPFSLQSVAKEEL